MDWTDDEEFLESSDSLSNEQEAPLEPATIEICNGYKQVAPSERSRAEVRVCSSAATHS